MKWIADKSRVELINQNTFLLEYWDIEPNSMGKPKQEFFALDFVLHLIANRKPMNWGLIRVFLMKALKTLYYNQIP